MSRTLLPLSVIQCSTRRGKTSYSFFSKIPYFSSSLRRIWRLFMLSPGITRKNFLVRVGAMAASLNISTVHFAEMISRSFEIGHSKSSARARFCLSTSVLSFMKALLEQPTTSNIQAFTNVFLIPKEEILRIWQVPRDFRLASFSSMIKQAKRYANLMFVRNNAI